MLKLLDIKNLAVVESATIELGPGFNVLTGQTGAGKSVLIKALQILLGQKSSQDLIRHGTDKLTVTGVFEIPEASGLTKYCADLGLDVKGGEIIIRREIRAPKARSSIWINDKITTLQTLKKVGSGLIDIFGQHESSDLLDSSRHVHLLDKFVDGSIISRYREGYRQMKTTLSKIETVWNALKTVSERLDYLQYRHEELLNFNPCATEYEDALSLSKELVESSRQKTELEKLVGLLEDHSHLSKSLSEAEQLTQKLNSLLEGGNEFLKVSSDFTEALSQLSYQAEMTLDQLREKLSRQEELEDRIGGYQDLFRKTGVKSVEELIAHGEKIESELLSAEDMKDELSELTSAFEKNCSDLIEAAASVTQAREFCAEKICREVELELKDLAMDDVSMEFRFSEVESDLFMDEKDPKAKEVVFSEHSLFDPLRAVDEDLLDKVQKLGPLGAERPKIFLRANVGEDVKPIEKVASGGELSRIMLSLKKVLTSGGRSCLLVFDEIDSGISGEIATKVGRKLKQLSESFQIICISHLAQVASFANSHIKVEKFDDGKRTFSKFSLLDPDESTREVARLMSGEKLTRSSINHAEQLKSNASKSKFGASKNPEASSPKGSSRKKKSRLKAPQSNV